MQAFYKMGIQIESSMHANTSNICTRLIHHFLSIETRFQEQETNMELDRKHMNIINTVSLHVRSSRISASYEMQSMQGLSVKTIQFFRPLF